VAVTERLAAASLRFSATRAGRTFTGAATMVIRGAEGKVAEVWHFATDTDAADAFWRGEAPPIRTDAVKAPAAATTPSTAPAADLDNGDLDTRFTRAADASRSLSKRPDQATLLKLYALFKQAGAGDATGSARASPIR
jgi:hypothetical protein